VNKPEVLQIEAAENIDIIGSRDYVRHQLQELRHVDHGKHEVRKEQRREVREENGTLVGQELVLVTVEIKSPSARATARYIEEARIINQKLDFMTMPKRTCPIRMEMRTSISPTKK
jgi:hypothetical protein